MVKDLHTSGIFSCLETKKSPFGLFQYLNVAAWIGFMGSGT